MKELFKKYIGSELVSVKYAKGVSDAEGKEFHVYNEIIYFMGGRGTFISDNSHVTLKPELLMIIPRGSYHQMCITGDEEEYHRLVLTFGYIPGLEALISRKLDRVLVLEANDNIRYLLDKLLSAFDRNTASASDGAVALAVLTLLLEEISGEKTLDGEGLQKDVLSERFADWIDKNIGGKISVADVAKAFNMSESGVAHIFKKEMNIPIYRYILKKRLMNAHEKIVSGVMPTQAALECGFNDYSGFYKQYKKMFGDPPSVNKNNSTVL